MASPERRDSSTVARSFAADGGARRAGRVFLRAVLFAGIVMVASAGMSGCAAGNAPTDNATDNGATGTGTAAGDGARARVHPAFDITPAELAGLVAQTPDAVREAVAERPSRFLELVARVIDEPRDRTLLVDKQHPLPEGYVPDALIDLDTLDDELALSRSGHRLTAATVAALVRMAHAAGRDGITLLVSSAYRSYDYQAGLFDRWVAELGEEEAELVSARPGTSQHQLGTTVDFGCICDAFASEPAGRWLAENAWRFGFSLSYPRGYVETTGYSYEPWHFRYIGSDAARLEHEFFQGIQQWMLEFLHANEAEIEQRIP